MGLFASRPEEPFEWAGLPSEPLVPPSDAELLETPPVDPFAISANSDGTSIMIRIADDAAASSSPAEDQ
ncbi:hypothetical protein ET475_14345 [Microbacterium protaetiae]|uniref:Uncharacterized protein n=1 Tax=Microbacterium protaetiae TaxID=2509458 RepID=A0A4P6EIG3_9MICO|nr:hypothetical protein [Microbacterium protaetiae]QAY61049.1 hypothetical protein ET475_14345 [Microbacterium protaetiae]